MIRGILLRLASITAGKKLAPAVPDVDITKMGAFDSLPTDDVYAVMLLAAQIPAYMDGYHPKAYIESIIKRPL